MTESRRSARDRRRDGAELSRFGTRVRFGRAKARGAALTEFVFLTIILVPLLFGTAMIGKLVDVRQNAVQASRYAAWEATVSGAPSAGADVGRRFFADGSVPLTSTGAEPGATVTSDGLPATSPAGVLHDTRVVVDPTQVALTDGGTRDLPGTAGAMGTAIEAAGNTLGTVSGNAWDLPKGRLLRRGITVPVDGNAWLVGGADGCAAGAAYACLTELSVIMTDGWSAPTPEKAGARSRSLVPASGLEDIADLLSTVSAIPVLKELGGLKGALGAVNTTVLPPSETGVRTLDEYDEGAAR